jgi:hypothetical protein
LESQLLFTVAGSPVGIAESFTDTTAARAVASLYSISERVAVGAEKFLRVNRCGADPAKHILAMRYVLEMVRVNAAMHATQMVWRARYGLAFYKRVH